MYSPVVFGLTQLIGEMPYSVLCAVTFFLLFCASLAPSLSSPSLAPRTDPWLTLSLTPSRSQTTRSASARTRLGPGTTLPSSSSSRSTRSRSARPLRRSRRPSTSPSRWCPARSSSSSPSAVRLSPSLPLSLLAEEPVTDWADEPAGVTVRYDELLGFWRFLYRVNPFTYVVEGTMTNEMHDLIIEVRPLPLPTVRAPLSAPRAARADARHPSPARSVLLASCACLSRRAAGPAPSGPAPSSRRRPGT